MAPRPTWWLVMTRPSGEMKEPEPPGKRTEDFWTCSYQVGGLSKPYFSLSNFSGGWLNSHMPSSAAAGVDIVSKRAAQAARLRAARKQGCMNGASLGDWVRVLWLYACQFGFPVPWDGRNSGRGVQDLLGAGDGGDRTKE